MIGKNKQEIRREQRRRAEGIPPAYYREASRRIGEKVLALPAWKQAGTVMLYVSMATEPDTRELIAAAVRAGKRVLLPRCTAGRQMEAVPFSGWDQMTDNAYGIPEPTGEATAEKPEVILVPCVAATPAGSRLGHGAGYYDRFLRNQPGHTVCLCFDEFLTEELPEEKWDIFMETVITEKEIYQRRSEKRTGEPGRMAGAEAMA
ncbi:MAG: 5-formyltetrahydrofolate cyclo-ligase [Clostridia bacterium]|nr:5-formyltetrahydrofolate cyclo-ligase [Clostridia bacterium]